MAGTGGTYGAALHMARAAARLAPEFAPGVAATVRANLRLAFGAADAGLVRGIYRHFAEAAVDLLFFERMSAAARFEFVGDGLDHYRAHGGPAVCVTGHFGNWELYAAAWHAEGLPVTVVARTPDAPWVARRIDSFRRRYAAAVLDKQDSLRPATRALREGARVAFLMDQSAGRHGIPAPFFGRMASTFTAPAALALRLGVPLYAGYSTRIGDGIRYRCHVEHVPVVGDVESLTATLNQVLEGYVRACPEQWWWFHRRFKPRRLLRRGRVLSAAGIPVR